MDSRSRKDRRPYGYWEKKILPEIWKLLKTYENYGFKPTLRQVFYRLVSAGLLRNTRAEYNQLSRHTREWREAGIELIYYSQRIREHCDLNHFTIGKYGLKAILGGYETEEIALPPDCFADKVREKLEVPTFRSLNDYLNSVLNSVTGGFFLDPWESQGKKVIVYLEKDALSSIVRQVTLRYRIPLLIARGYASFTLIWESIILEEFTPSKPLTVLVLTDYDPSGEDMVRDVRDRVKYYARFSDIYLEDEKLPVIKKIALTREQVEKYKLLPNPMKVTDPRAEKFRRERGEAAYELDALDPPELLSIIEKSILDEIKDPKAFKETLKHEKQEREKIRKIFRNLKQG
ncbi:MAG: hypothetical protein QXO15_02705 [Nitrososphaerota archaeon]